MLKRLWRTSPELIATAAVMQIVLIGALVGLAVDPRLITGAPAWLKPAKFAASITIYTVTLAWIFTWLPERTRTRRVVGWVTAITMLVEIAIIGGQAWRGTTSHFNVGTVFDGCCSRSWDWRYSSRRFPRLPSRLRYRGIASRTEPWGGR